MSTRFARCWMGCPMVTNLESAHDASAAFAAGVETRTILYADAVSVSPASVGGSASCESRLATDLHQGASDAAMVSRRKLQRWSPLRWTDAGAAPARSRSSGAVVRYEVSLLVLAAAARDAASETDNLTVRRQEGGGR